MDNIKKYNKIRKVISNNPKNIDTFVPSPNENDYKKGYITRFFIQQTNDVNSPIYEVSSLNFRRYSTSKGYKGTSIRWRIKGPTSITYNKNNEVSDKGVKQSNKIAISLVSDKIKNLKLYLPNLIQFHKI